MRRGLIAGYRALWRSLSRIALALTASTSTLSAIDVSDTSEVIDGSAAWLREAGWGTAAALVFCTILTIGRHRSPAVERPLLMLGDASYSLYLVHVPVIQIVIRRVPAVVPVWADALLAVVASVAAGLFVYFPIERPRNRSARRLLSRLEHPAPAGGTNS